MTIKFSKTAQKQQISLEQVQQRAQVLKNVKKIEVMGFDPSKADSVLIGDSRIRVKVWQHGKQDYFYSSI